MIQIKESVIIEAADKGMDEFLKVFTDAYISVLEDGMTAHVLFQAISHKLSIFCIHSRIFFSADLHDIFIEAFAFVGSCYNGISGFPMEQRFIVTAMDFSVVSFLSVEWYHVSTWQKTLSLLRTSIPKTKALSS